MGKWCSLRNLKNRRSVKSILLDKKLLGLVEMISGLVNASFSLPKWQAVKMIFFTPWKGAFFFFSIGWCEYYSRNSCIRRRRYKPFLIFLSKNLIHEKYDKIPINITSLLIQTTFAGANVIIEHLDKGFFGIIRSHRALMIFTSLPDFQHVKKVVSDSLGQVDFSIWLMNSVLNLPNRQVKIFEEFKLQT